MANDGVGRAWLQVLLLVALAGCPSESDLGGGSAGHPQGGSEPVAGASNGPGGAGGSGPPGGGAVGGGASDGGAGTGGVPPLDYDPCPPRGTPCAIMPLGDSLTFGDHGDNTNDGSYRPQLFHLTLREQHSITFVGQGVNGPDMVDGQPFPKNHDGFPGFTIDDGPATPGITGLAADHVKTYKPHIVTLMIGTNDVVLENEVEDAPARLGHLIDLLVEADPNLLVVVAQIPPGKDDAINARAETYNAAIPGVVAARARAGKHVAIVDMYAAFTQNPNFKADYVNDLVHPTQVGYDVMGDTWFALLGPLFR
jgi:lysophospholipase L1-like esterase